MRLYGPFLQDDDHNDHGHHHDHPKDLNDNHVNLIGPTMCAELSARNGLKSIELATVAHDGLILSSSQSLSSSSLSTLSSSSSLSS